MEELRTLLHTIADDAIEMTQTTFDLIPDTVLSECFPFNTYRTVTIDGFNYSVTCEIKLKPIG